MAHKQALRDFQEQLAERLRSARTADVSAAWLAVRAGQKRLLVPLSHASGVFPYADVQRVPYVQPWFAGIANLRGELCGVVDLAIFLGQAATAPRSAPALAQCRLIGFNAQLQTNGALLVDEVLGMRTVQSFARSDPAEEQAAGWFGHVYTDTQGQVWQEISLQTLSEQQGFLDIGA